MLEHSTVDMNTSAFPRRMCATVSGTVIRALTSRIVVSDCVLALSSSMGDFIFNCASNFMSWHAA